MEMIWNQEMHSDVCASKGFPFASSGPFTSHQVAGAQAVGGWETQSSHSSHCWLKAFAQKHNFVADAAVFALHALDQIQTLCTCSRRQPAGLSFSELHPLQSSRFSRF